MYPSLTKADMDCEAFEDGYLAAIYTPEGGSAKVGAPVAVLVANKDDVGKVINDSLWLSSISFDIEKDFISLIQCADMSTWFDEWKVFNDLDAIG